MFRILPFVAAAALSLSMSLPAHAFPPIPKVPKVPKAADIAKKAAGDAEANDRKQMSQVNSLAQEGIRRVPGNFFGKFDKKSEDMAQARVAYDDCVARLKLVSDPSINEGAMRYWNEFKLAYEQGELQLPASKALDPIEKLHGQRIPVQDADLDALDAAVGIFEKGVHADNARVLAKWKDTAAKARETNKELLKSASAKAAKDAATLDLSQRNAILDQGEEALKAMKVAMDADAGPIDPAVWASFEDALKKADVYSPKIRTSFTDAAWIYTVYDAWYSPDGAKAVAAAYGGGDVHASAIVTKKEARIGFEVEAGNCYALIGRFNNRTGNEELKDIDRVWDKDYASVVPFVGGRGIARFHGGCPTKNMRLNFDIKLQTAGSKVEYQWIAVAWPRAKFPVDIAARSDAWGPEPCSAPMMENVFKNAVPGLLVWSAKGAPVLLNGINQGSFMVRSVKRRDHQINISTATSAWPAKKDLEDSTFYQTCSTYEDSMDPLVNTMIKCHQAINKQYGPKYASAKKRRENARTIGARKAANDELDRIETAEKKVREAKCGPLEVKVEKAMTAAIERINDWFLAGEGPTGIPDVPAYVRDVDEGRDRFKE